MADSGETRLFILATTIRARLERLLHALPLSRGFRARGTDTLP